VGEPVSDAEMRTLLDRVVAQVPPKGKSDRDIERDAPNESPGFEDERETTGRSLKRNPRTTRPGLEE
jgi:hypothetical protein